MSGFSPRQIEECLVENVIYEWHGDFFTQALAKRLG